MTQGATVVTAQRLQHGTGRNQDRGCGDPTKALRVVQHSHHCRVTVECRRRKNINADAHQIIGPWARLLGDTSTTVNHPVGHPWRSRTLHTNRQAHADPWLFRRNRRSPNLWLLGKLGSYPRRTPRVVDELQEVWNQPINWADFLVESGRYHLPVTSLTQLGKSWSEFFKKKYKIQTTCVSVSVCDSKSYQEFRFSSTLSLSPTSVYFNLTFHLPVLNYKNKFG